MSKGGFGARHAKLMGDMLKEQDYNVIPEEESCRYDQICVWNAGEGKVGVPKLMREQLQELDAVCKDNKIRYI